MKMDLALNNLQRLICHKTNQNKPSDFSNLLFLHIYRRAHTHTHTHTHEMNFLLHKTEFSISFSFKIFMNCIVYNLLYKLLVIWKSDLTDKMKRSFFQAAVVLILLYGCTTWTLTKQLEKKLDSNYTRMLRAILNKSWRQHPTKHQLYGHLPPITKTIQVRRTRHAGHCWRSRDKLISDVYPLDPHIWPG